MPEIAASASSRTDIQHRDLRALALIIIFGIFSTTMAQPQALGRLPLQFLLKNDVHVTREQMAEFFFWCGLAWYLKPFAGILTDAFPFFGTRRRHYLLFSSVLTALCWIGMAFLHSPSLRRSNRGTRNLSIELLEVTTRNGILHYLV